MTLCFSYVSQLKTWWWLAATHYLPTRIPCVASPQRLPKVSCFLQAMSRTAEEREGTHHSKLHSQCTFVGALAMLITLSMSLELRKQHI